MLFPLCPTVYGRIHIRPAIVFSCPYMTPMNICNEPRYCQLFRVPTAFIAATSRLSPDRFAGTSLTSARVMTTGRCLGLRARITSAPCATGCNTYFFPSKTFPSAKQSSLSDSLCVHGSADGLLCCRRRRGVSCLNASPAVAFFFGRGGSCLADYSVCL